MARPVPTSSWAAKNGWAHIAPAVEGMPGPEESPMVSWNLRSADNRTWHDGDLGRLEAWVASEDARLGLAHVPPRSPFRSASRGYGHPVPDHFDHRR